MCISGVQRDPAHASDVPPQRGHTEAFLSGTSGIYEECRCPGKSI